MARSSKGQGRMAFSRLQGIFLSITVYEYDQNLLTYKNIGQY